MKDGLLALWLVFRFNLFCGLSSAYRELPAPRKVESGRQIVDTNV